MWFLLMERSGADSHSGADPHSTKIQGTVTPQLQNGSALSGTAHLHVKQQARHLGWWKFILKILNQFKESGRCITSTISDFILLPKEHFHVLQVSLRSKGAKPETE